MNINRFCRRVSFSKRFCAPFWIVLCLNIVALGCVGLGCAGEVQAEYKLSISRTGNGTVTSSPDGIDCGAVCVATYKADGMVVLTATPADGWVFDGWSGDDANKYCQGNNEPSCMLMFWGEPLVLNIAATFKLPISNGQSEPLRLFLQGSGKGTVMSLPASIKCNKSSTDAKQCSANFASGSTVRLTATPSKGSRFLGWSLNGFQSKACDKSTVCEVSVNGSSSFSGIVEVTGIFEVITQRSSLSVFRYDASKVKPAKNVGTIISVGSSEINCGKSCGHGYPVDTKVTLQAIPASGYKFVGFVVDLNYTMDDTVDDKVAIALTSPSVYVYAYFAPLNSRSIMVGETITGKGLGVGAGTLVAKVGNNKPIYITRLSFLAAPFAAKITLTAIPSTGYKFASWPDNGLYSPICSGTTPLCSFSMPAKFNIVAAEFTKKRRISYVTKPTDDEAVFDVQNPQD